MSTKTTIWFDERVHIYREMDGCIWFGVEGNDSNIEIKLMSNDEWDDLMSGKYSTEETAKRLFAEQKK